MEIGVSGEHAAKHVVVMVQKQDNATIPLHPAVEQIAWEKPRSLAESHFVQVRE